MQISLMLGHQHVQSCFLWLNIKQNRNNYIKPNLSIHVGNVLYAECHQRVDCVDETVCWGRVWGGRWVRRAGTVQWWVAGASSFTTHRKKGLLNPFPSLSACPQPVRCYQLHTLEASCCINLLSIKKHALALQKPLIQLKLDQILRR